MDRWEWMDGWMDGNGWTASLPRLLPLPRHLLSPPHPTMAQGSHLHEAARHVARLGSLDGSVDQPLSAAHGMEPKLGGRQPREEAVGHKALASGGLIAARVVRQRAVLRERGGGVERDRHPLPRGAGAGAPLPPPPLGSIDLEAQADRVARATLAAAKHIASTGAATMNYSQLAMPPALSPPPSRSPWSR
eukprot:59230-Chlamydomonas_euryale.AAC.2